MQIYENTNRKVLTGSIYKSDEAAAKLAGEQKICVSPPQYQERQQHSNNKLHPYVARLVQTIRRMVQSMLPAK